MTDQEWDDLRRTNIDAFVHLARRALPELERTGGNLVAVGSVSGMRGDWGQSGYNATKALVMNFVQSLALDYGARGVRLNSVAPSFTQTEATAASARTRRRWRRSSTGSRSAVPAARRTSPRPSSSWPAATPPTSRARP